jgi:hypothetical protein
VKGVVAVGALVAFAAGLGTRTAEADPQMSLGLTLGGAIEGASGARKAEGAFHIGGRADVLFLRSRGTDMAVGPYLDVASSSFHDFDAGGGLEWLLPVRDDLPLVLSAGAFARNGEGRQWQPGLDGTLFFGSRSYNFHSVYGMSIGLFAQARWVPPSSMPGVVDTIFGVQIDGEILAMPSILIWSSIIHSIRSD